MEAVILPNLFKGTQQEEITAFYDLEHPSNDPNNWEQKRNGIWEKTYCNVAKMMQMFLQNGNYAGNQILSENSLRLFNKCYYCSDGNRRGVGFDKPQLKLKGPTCNCLSMMSFGHTGWTGTIAWADPDTEIVYVFLSNRSYPDGEMAINSRLVKENIRSEIQKVIYESIID